MSLMFPTKQLRFVEREGRVPVFHESGTALYRLEIQRVLQQQWVSDGPANALEWRDVPTEKEEGT